MSNSAERVYQKLKADILSGALTSGQPLRESALGAKYGVSRTPVRDALKHLLVDGLIEVVPNAGARVISISEETAAEITEIRALLEGHAAALAARKASPSQLLQLEKIVDEMEMAVSGTSEPDVEQVALTNNAFHQQIIAIADNAQLAAALKQVTNIPLILRKFASFPVQRMRASVAQHREIVGALSAGDHDWAQSAMRAHIYAASNFDAQFAQA